ncbi:hypothetical protein [Paenibacillus beijingensis]|uniref:Uncharacterized protein n=1 Tax=Paenibacillus beijingensis TaxID=1126833 RepID=A0A0D5NM20_9BACL|nr:hypothetical protein [Paenibacillus beijingensis]AJY76180.1 hypothetical protein VN24_18455 [Paenibacillus beijingensis]
MFNLSTLAQLLKQKNEIDRQMASILRRPAMLGHTGEFIASNIFNITLQESANSKGIDGYFNKQPLQGYSVNIKWYTKDSRMLDINPNGLPDYFLVLTGDGNYSLGSSKGTHAPWIIKKIYLFNTKLLMENLKTRKVKIGIATSIIKTVWEQGEIYPENINKELVISNEQRDLIRLFDEAENVI